MILLDTNVILEPMRAEPDPAVVAWLNRQHASALFTSSICVMELRFGVDRLPDGKRKAALWEALAFTLSRLIGPRILPFDGAAAVEASSIAARLERAGTALGLADGQIAATASVHGYAVATRDVDPFQAAGLTVINPWKDAP